MILPEQFYTGDNVVEIAKSLLGKVLVTNVNNEYTAGIITETEAYAGITDKASHAFGGRRTVRTETMYNNGGVAYVYLCYGIHHLFNVVTNKEDIPHAILIRGLEPIDGISIMLRRRKREMLSPLLTSGPGVLSAAMGITTQLSGHKLMGPDIYIDDSAPKIEEDKITSGTRVGVGYAQDDALLPYRFWIKGNKYVSKAKGL